VDATIEAQKILSAVTRVGQRFGINYIIDLLRGSSTVRPEHKALKTFGIGKDIGKEQWRQYIHELLHLKILEQRDGEFPVLQLSEKSQAILKGEQTVMLVKSVTARKEATPGKFSSKEIDNDLLKTLKSLRYQIARNEDVAAFQVFSDATLVELATYLPLTKTDLSKISGFGAIKLERYGPNFLDAIIDHCRANNLATKMSEKGAKRGRKPNAPDRVTETKRLSLQMFQSGRSIDEIAVARELKRSTIEEHLGHFIFNGEVSINEIVNKDKVATIIKAIESNKNSLAIAPVKQKLGEHYSYGEISAVMQYLRRMSEA
jgi:ATP-dependent DNA helicase RecQ